MQFSTVILIIGVLQCIRTDDVVENVFAEAWATFKVAYKKQYNPDEESKRMAIWKKNLAHIIKHNIEASMGKYSYTLGLNHFSDRTNEEISRGMNPLISSSMTLKKNGIFSTSCKLKHSRAVDWRKKGLVTEVKDQGACGPCYAFAALGSLEGQNKRKIGKLVSLSAQNIVDCSFDEGNKGCHGGTIENSFEYIIQNNGVNTEESYPYEDRDLNCTFKKKSVGATMNHYVEIPSNDENALRAAVSQIGPIAVAIQASLPDFISYNRGIYDNEKCTNDGVNHAALVVGYGTTKGLDYWIVKNSWGPYWGEKGYIRIARNKNNRCGIAFGASYSIV